MNRQPEVSTYEEKKDDHVHHAEVGPGVDHLDASEEQTAKQYVQLNVQFKLEC